MVEVTEIRQIECKELGDKIKLEVSPYYFKVIVGRKTYCFNKELANLMGHRLT